MSVIAITHTAAEGTLVYGTARGDGSKDILGPAGFRWYRSMDAWGIVGSRDRRPNTAKIEQAAAALRAAGFTVVVDVDHTLRPAEVAEADLVARREARAEALRAAARGDQSAQRAWDSADRAAQAVPPGGEPIKIGHHSEGRHRKAIATAQKTMARAVAAEAEAEARRRKAAASEAAEVHRRNPVTIRNRIERLESDQRRDERARDGYRRTLSRADGAAEECQPATGRYRDRLLMQIADRQEQIDYWKRVYATQQAEGIATAYTREMVSQGDAVRYRNRWYEVTRVNAKSVTVKMAHGTGTVSYHQISDHRAVSRRAAEGP